MVDGVNFIRFQLDHIQIIKKKYFVSNISFTNRFSAFVFVAMIVRFLTRRFIGEYDSKQEKVYTFNTVVDNEVVVLEILDTARQTNVC